MSNQVLAYAVGAGATIAAANAVKNSSALQDTITKGLKKIASSNFVKESIDKLTPYAKKAAPYAEKALSWVVALPTPAKAVLATGAVLTGLAANLIGHKGSENQGKILQKYEDKQTIQKALNNI